jgi:hypothetical protein
MTPQEWMQAVLEGVTGQLYWFLQLNWRALMLLSGLFLILVVINQRWPFLDQRWLLLDKTASGLGAVLASIYQNTKESGRDWLWWPLFVVWMVMALPFFVVVMLIALITNGVPALFRFAARRLGITLNAA